ncbi:MAG: hypothetical protein IKB07_02935 [Lachnospiraceae bacterium]|nr:hypothetical protein [Lachnospiraceae bacterium]
MKKRKITALVLLCISILLLIAGLLLAFIYGDTFKTESNSPLLIVTITCIILAILLIGAVFGIFLVSLSKSAYPTKPAQFDERQILISGKGAEYGLVTVALIALVMLFWDVAELPQFAEPGALLILATLLGFLVYSVYRVWHGAYFVINGNPKYITSLFGVYTAITLLIGISDLLDGKLIENGLLTHHCLMLSSGIVFLFVLATMGLKALKDRKDEDA